MPDAVNFYKLEFQSLPSYTCPPKIQSSGSQYWRNSHGQFGLFPLERENGGVSSAEENKVNPFIEGPCDTVNLSTGIQVNSSLSLNGNVQKSYFTLCIY
jgi:hypothetical protein